LGPLSSARRDLFVWQLDEMLESIPARPWWRVLLFTHAVPGFGKLAPSFKGALVIVMCAGLILFSVGRGHFQTVSAAEFLNRATALDQNAAKITGSEVMRRRFRVKTKKNTFEHDAYRDISGSRQRRPAKGEPEDADLTAHLALAGGEWDDPLSAVSFKAWHDRQVNPVDEVHSSEGGLLTVGTRAASSSIVQESLTVRQHGFHPVERTIEFRDAGTVVISEVSQEFLNWDRANQLHCKPQPVEGELIRSAPDPAPVIVPSRVQLDETELMARLALNQLRADTGEQIEIRRDDKGVQIQGLVEDEKRKKELNELLRAIPFLSLTIASFDDLKFAASPEAQGAAKPQTAVVAQVSSLERYFMQHPRSRDELSRISAGLFNSSLAIRRSSRSIDQISERFFSDELLSRTAIQARDELLSRTLARLLGDLRDEKQFLDESGILFDSVALSPNDAAADCASSLTRLAERNADATKELISGFTQSGRSEIVIAAELAGTISRLRTAGLIFIPNRRNIGAISSCP
jgi:hypothetical protein